MSTVRIASKTDEDRLFAFVWGAYEETPHAAKSERRVRDVVRAATRQQTFTLGDAVMMPPIFGIIDGPHGIEAGVGLHPEQWWYSDTYAMRGFFFFVLPEYRRGPKAHTHELKRFSIEFAKQSGMPLVETCYGPPDAPKKNVYQKYMEPIGTVYASGLSA